MVPMRNEIFQFEKSRKKIERTKIFQYFVENERKLDAMNAMR